MTVATAMTTTIITERPGRRKYDLSWNRGNTAALLLLLLAAGVATAAALPGRTWFDQSVVVNPQRAFAAMEKIDPNSASLASLCRLPGVGPGRAKTILAYRAAHGERPFRTAADLANIRGIGARTIERLAPYLDLPAGTSKKPEPGTEVAGSP
jgi:competence ComEA-like helix-hairpin-helix protein